VILFALACVRTPPHTPFDGTWEKRVSYHEEHRGDEYCVVEQEALLVDQVALWAASAPEPEQNWCRESGEHARWFDVAGQDGVFLSARVSERSAPPDRYTERCVTWNLDTRAEATLRDYDPERAAARLAEVSVKMRALGEGWTLDEDAFLVSKGHVTFCVTRGGEVALVPVN
jgi:hypothetical protein